MTVVVENKNFRLFAMSMSFRQTPLTELSKRDVAYVKFLCNIKAEFVSHQFPLCFHV